ncbi:MAG: hypothetical protein AAGJ18_11835, partial [Bacteroidota bacterium]
MPTTLIQNPEDLQLNNHHEIDQILGNPPSWLLRWGISLVFIAVFIFATLAWFIKYPDTVAANVQLLTENPAIRVVPLASGAIEQLLVDNQQTVAQGDLLAIVESTAQPTDVTVLADKLSELKEVRQSVDYLAIALPSDLALGNMQNSYARLVQQVTDYQYFVQQTSSASKIYALKRQIVHTGSINQSLRKQQ